MTPLEEVVAESEKLRALVLRHLPSIDLSALLLTDPQAVNTMRVVLGFARGCLHEALSACDREIALMAAHHKNCVEDAHAAGEQPSDLASLIGLPKQPPDDAASEGSDDADNNGDKSNDPPRHH